MNKTGQDLIKKAHTDDKAKNLESDLVNLNCRWSDVYSAVDERMETLERTLGQLRQLQVIFKQNYHDFVNKNKL